MEQFANIILAELKSIFDIRFHLLSFVFDAVLLMTLHVQA